MHLTASQIEKCLSFARKAAVHTQKVEYGQKDSAERPIEEIARDIFVGKLGECAFQNLLHEHGIEVELDFNDYGPGKWDTDDVSYGSGDKKWKIDVKCTKDSSKWFLVEWNKLNFREHDKELPHYFVLTQVPSSCYDLSAVPNRELDVKVTGFIDLHRLQPGGDKTHVLRRGSVIPGSRSERGLTADNLGVKICDLDTDWLALVQRMQNEEPFDTSFFHAPKESTADFLNRLELVSDVRGKEDISSLSSIYYSLLISGSEVDKISDDELEQYFMHGIKCLLFVDEKRAQVLKKRFGSTYGRSCFNLYIPSDDTAVPPLRIIDGQMTNEEKQKASVLGEIAYQANGLNFNWEQYLVEHAPFDGAMIVRASAGTGKTKVMMDRILFLLATVDGLEPRKIGMITFTNAAAGQMMERIQERLEAFYAETGQKRFLQWMEHLSEMRIQTIDSFFKRIISEEGSWLGYGTGASIRGFAKEKKDIIEEVLDELLRKSKARDYLKKFQLTRSEYVKFAYDYWNKFNSRGFFADDIERMDFGSMKNQEDFEIVNETLKTLIVEAERRYQQVKQKENAFALSDIKAEMGGLTQTKCGHLRLTELSCLFVDEFQDTDNSQIRSLAWLQKVLSCQLFVVGDVKQSIYRFRGAEENAFDELKRCLKANGLSARSIRDYVLKKNYRTCANVLQSLDENFLCMGRGSEPDLPYTKDESVEPCRMGTGSIVRKNISRRKIQGTLLETLNLCIKKGRKIAVLCRSNKQAARVDELCRDNGIVCLLRRSGGFYCSEPVRDFLAVLGAVLYPDDVRYLYGILLTPYSSMVPDGLELGMHIGDEYNQHTYLRGLFNAAGFEEVLDKMPKKPAFQLLRDILDRFNPVGRYQMRREAGFSLYGTTADAELDTAMYELNLNKLFQLLYEHFAGEFASVLEIFDFLRLKVQTDREEDILYPEPEDVGKKVVEAMTIHKSKGLEYETVILPFTYDSFMLSEDWENFRALYTENQAPYRTGWAFYHRGALIANDHYEDLKGSEYQASRREASRLLYVAATRCRRDLIIFAKRAPDDMDTWAGLMQEWKEVGEL